MTEAPPKLDFSRISFPSDRITLKQIRPHQWKGLHLDDQLVQYDLEGTLNSRVEGMRILQYRLQHERMLALEAFERVLNGRAQSRPGEELNPERESRVVRREFLDRFYQEYGLSSGPKQSIELIRDIEAQAASQAKEYLGRGR